MIQKFWKEEAHAEGKAEGVAIATLKFVRNLLKGGKLTPEEIAESAGITVDEVLRIAKESHLAY